ncbi:MAG: hypothetical protein J7L47_01970 [Candidatus Odinarchaeota archaeon]|nr:hypothetical protein [Candidatus Odinarchaeota archaeon]
MKISAKSSMLLFVIILFVLSMPLAVPIMNSGSRNPLVNKKMHTSSQEIKLYMLSSKSSFDIQLATFLKNQNISVTESSIFNRSSSRKYSLLLVSYDWLYSSSVNTVKSFEEFLFKDGVPVVFYGKGVHNLYTILNTTKILSSFSIIPGTMTSNGTIILNIPKTVTCIGLFVAPVVNKTRVPVVQLFLIGKLSFQNIFSHILTWFPMLRTYVTSGTVNANDFVSRSDISSSSYKTSSITPENWDDDCGYFGWYITDISYEGTDIAEMQLLARYWHTKSVSHPDAWDYFLAHFTHKIVPKVGSAAPYESITQMDVNTDEYPGQILLDYGPINWGGPTETISFEVSAGESDISAKVSYSFSPDSISWGDQSDPARGIQRTYHSYTKLGFIPYGYTSTVEPTAIFLKDANKAGGAIPLRVIHYAWSRIFLEIASEGYFLETSNTFTVLLNPPSGITPI